LTVAVVSGTAVERTTAEGAGDDATDPFVATGPFVAADPFDATGFEALAYGCGPSP
jgi:hypothetical protein